MILFHLILGSILGFGSEIKIEDDIGFLTRLGGATSFSEAFSCPSTAYVYAGTSVCDFQCSPGFCKVKCNELRDKSSVFTEDCSSSSLKIYGDQGLEFHLSEKEYVDSSSTWITSFLKGSGQFVTATIKSIRVNFPFHGMVDFVHDGIKESFVAVRLDLTLNFEGGGNTSADLWVNPKGKGLNQILQFNNGKNILYKRKGFFEGKM